MSDVFLKFQAELISRAKAASKQDGIDCQKIFDETNVFLKQHNVCAAGAALEKLDQIGLQFNLGVETVNDVGLEHIIDLVDATCKLSSPENKQAVVLQIVRTLSGTNDDRSALFGTNRQTEGLIPMSEIAGRFAANSITSMYKSDMGAMESFGIDMDRIQTDSRLNIAVTILRAQKSLLERVLPRVTVESAVLNIRVPSPEVYDLMASQSPSSAVRNSQQTRTPFIKLYKNPSVANTAPQSIVPLAVNDTNDVLLQDGVIKVGSRANLWDLAAVANKPQYSNFDFTDLVSEGGMVQSVFVQASRTVGGTTTTELFEIPAKFLATSYFVGTSTNIVDSADRIANLKLITTLNSASTTSTGASTTLLSAYAAPAEIQLTVGLTANLNLKSADISANGGIQTSLVATDGTTIASAIATDYSGLSFQIVGYQPDLQYSEENLRKMSLAVRMNARQISWEIPVGRMIAVDYSLGQQTPEEVLQIVSATTSIGNDDRGLVVIRSKLEDTYARVQYELANPQIGYYDQLAYSYAAGTLSLPYVVEGEIDFSDVANMRESERLSDIHSRLKSFVLGAVADIHNQSLFQHNLDPNERTVFKIITSTLIRDLLFDIPQYHNALKDIAQTATNADFSMDLPNGDRLDVVGTNFEEYTGLMLMFPIREAKPTDVTSFASIKDAGTFVAQYTPVSNGAANKRVVTSSRELPYVTNPVGALFTIKSLPVNVLPYISGLQNAAF